MLLQDGGQCNKNYARRVVRCPPKERCEVISVSSPGRRTAAATMQQASRPQSNSRVKQPVGRRPPAAAWRRANAKKASSRRNWLLCLVEFPGQAGNDAWITPRDGHGVRHGRHRDGRHGHRGGHHDGHRAGGVHHHGAHRLHPGQRR